MSASEWKPEFGLWDPPKETWTKIDPADAYALVAAQSVRCDECHDPIRPEGPVRIWVNQDGVLRRRLCGACVRMYVARKRVEAAKEDILKRTGKGRSKGWLSKELMREGRHLADIREAFAELLDEGRLVQHGGTVRRPRQAEALF